MGLVETLQITGSRFTIYDDGHPTWMFHSFWFDKWLSVGWLIDISGEAGTRMSGGRKVRHCC